MPIYEYQCKSCGKVSEIISSGHSSTGEISCGHCGSSELEKRLSVVSIPRMPARPAGKTCCGRDERCGSPSGGECCKK